MSSHARVLLAVLAAAAVCAPVASAAPTFTSVPPAVTTDNTPSFAWTGTRRARFSWTLAQGDRSIRSGSTRNTSLTLATLADGAYSFTVTELGGDDDEDEAGSASASFIVAATAPPPAPQLTTLPAALSSEAQPTVAWRGQAGATFRLSVLRGGAVVVAPPPTTATSLRVGPLAEGVYTLSLVQSDALGRTSPAAGSPAFTVDLTPPPAPTLAPPGPLVTNAPPRIALAGEIGATFAWQVTGPAARQGTTATVDFAGLADGVYTVTVRAVDALRRQSQAATTTVTLDRVASAPPAGLTIPVVSADPAPIASWRGEPGALFRWSVDNGAQKVQTGETRDGSVRVAALPDGLYGIEVVQIDLAGNASGPSRVVFRIARPAPPPPPTIVPVVVRAAKAPPRLLVTPYGVVRPWSGLSVRKRQPLLRWRVRNGLGPDFYNVQIYRGRQKVHSAFPQTNLYRVPKGKLRPGVRYYWQVWAYRRGVGYGTRPIAVSYFQVGRRAK